jgi:hypothetical protein
MRFTRLLLPGWARAVCVTVRPHRCHRGGVLSAGFRRGCRVNRPGDRRRGAVGYEPPTRRCSELSSHSSGVRPAAEHGSSHHKSTHRIREWFVRQPQANGALWPAGAPRSASEKAWWLDPSGCLTARGIRGRSRAVSAVADTALTGTVAPACEPRPAVHQAGAGARSSVQASQKASTTTGSNCVPAQLRSSVRASSGVMASL